MDDAAYAMGCNILQTDDHCQARGCNTQTTHQAKYPPYLTSCAPTGSYASQQYQTTCTCLTGVAPTQISEGKGAGISA